MTPEQRIQDHFKQSINDLSTSVATQTNLIRSAADRIANVLLQGGKVLVCGNGGSAAM